MRALCFSSDELVRIASQCEKTILVWPSNGVKSSRHVDSEELFILPQFYLRSSAFGCGVFSQASVTANGVKRGEVQWTIQIRGCTSGQFRARSHYARLVCERTIQFSANRDPSQPSRGRSAPRCRNFEFLLPEEGLSALIGAHHGCPC